MPLVLNIQEIGAREAIRLTAEALTRGQLTVIPTDTVYGLAADARHPSAVRRLFEVKGRDPNKPIPLLAASLEDVEARGALLDRTERRLAQTFWPGPLTLVLRVNHTGWAEREGFRAPADETAMELIRMAGGPLRVTSANSSGSAPALTAMEAEHALGSSVDVVLDAGPAPGGIPSTVVQVAQGKIDILREGALSRKQLECVAFTNEDNGAG